MNKRELNFKENLIFCYALTQKLYPNYKIFHSLSGSPQEIYFCNEIFNYLIEEYENESKVIDTEKCNYFQSEMEKRYDLYEYDNADIRGNYANEFYSALHTLLSCLKNKDFSNRYIVEGRVRSTIAFLISEKEGELVTNLFHSKYEKKTIEEYRFNLAYFEYFGKIEVEIHPFFLHELQAQKQLIQKILKFENHPIKSKTIEEFFTEYLSMNLTTGENIEIDENEIKLSFIRFENEILRED